MINNIWIEIDMNKIKERYEKVKNYTNSEIIPVIKNNANGLGFNAMLEIYKSLGVKTVAASYASEFYFKAKNDEINKLAWIWKPCKEILEIKNIILCCKNFEQLEFCIENNIPYHIVFNIGMNRGGFIASDISKLATMIKDEWIIATHCPYSNVVDIKMYYDKVLRLKEKINNHGINIKYIHAANSIVFRECVECHFDGVRLGEVLLLPNRDKFGIYDPISVKTTVAEIMDLKKGDNIGYNHKILNENTRVAVIPVGYYNFDKISKVMINGTVMNVLAQLHDLTLVSIDKTKDININDEVIINNLKLSEIGNWNKCIQRTFKFNNDLIAYKYKE